MIDDDPDDVALVQWAINKTKSSISLSSINNPEKAVDFLIKDHEPNQALPDVILLDLNMPAMRGTEVLKKLKGNDKTNLIPIVVFSTSSNPEDVKQCYSLHANSYIPKPSTSEGLRDLIEVIGKYWISSARLD